MKPIASLSLDLDNQWSYMKTHGDAGWEAFPSYLDTVVPRILGFLADRGLKITIFVVGQDAVLEKNHGALASVASAGHEIGNHSFNHEPWLHLYSRDELVTEFEKTEAAIEKVTGKRPIGFRGPGYSLSPTVIDVLVDRGYVYDCSVLPTYIAPLSRAYYFLKSPKMSDAEREKRKKLFGKFSDGSQSLKAAVKYVGDRPLVEIPVTTLPLFKTPIHASYVIYLASFSQPLARMYWKMALMMCKVGGVEPSLLLHPLDFLSGDDVPELKFFPGMGLSIDRKLAILGDIIGAYTNSFDVVNMNAHAKSVLENIADQSIAAEVLL